MPPPPSTFRAALHGHSAHHDISTNKQIPIFINPKTKVTLTRAEWIDYDRLVKESNNIARGGNTARKTARRNPHAEHGKHSWLAQAILQQRYDEALYDNLQKEAAELRGKDGEIVVCKICEDDLLPEEQHETICCGRRALVLIARQGNAGVGVRPDRHFTPISGSYSGRIQVVPGCFTIRGSYKAERLQRRGDGST
ncbi:hypothetical protein SVAN01_04929 [Stagonosporopsis vannaccii]|nr:hypothetical protein SVAN01_04929 [Stagonosporopsis vannaccii]